MQLVQSGLVLDTNVIIAILEKPGVAARIRSGLRGKSVRIILCDVVLGELERVRKYSADVITGKISDILGRKVEISRVTRDHITNARLLSSRFEMCHAGDNKILSMCQLDGHVLVTYDGDLRKTCDFVGVPGFHPANIQGI